MSTIANQDQEQNHLGNLFKYFRRVVLGRGYYERESKRF